MMEFDAVPLLNPLLTSGLTSFASRLVLHGLVAKTLQPRTMTAVPGSKVLASELLELRITIHKYEWSRPQFLHTT